MRVPMEDLLQTISRALDFVEAEVLGATRNHSKRTAYVCASICRTMGLSEADIADMAGCAILHDNALTACMQNIGGGISGRLNNFESHCAIGEETASAFPFIGDTKGIILYHHENWNGTGFYKLAGAAIPLRAQILRLAENLDLNLGMGNARPSLEAEIRKHVGEYSGKLYSPIVVEALRDIQDKDFILNMSHGRIDISLNRVVPDLFVELSIGSMLDICSIFAFIVDSKSIYTTTHSTGIAEKAGTLGLYFGLDDNICKSLRMAGYLHDVGKLSTPLSILEKSGELTKAEWSVMREHVLMSEEMLMGIGGMDRISSWVCDHHERLDGAGYPFGRCDTELSFESRIVACCDIYQALIEDRPHRKGISHAKAAYILNDMAGMDKIDGHVAEAIGDLFGP